MPDTIEVRRRQVEDVIRAAADLHTLPSLHFELQQTLGDPRTCAQDVAALLSRDPAISGRVLRVANSAYYGLPRRVRNLSQAIVILGFQAIRNLALTLGVIDAFGRKASDGFDPARFWAHSVATAIAADRLGRRWELDDLDALYTAGLLHDVGKLVAAIHLPGLQAMIVHAESTAPIGRLEREREVLGYDHADLGSRVLERWNLPPAIVAATANHHREDAGAAAPEPVTDVVQLANAIVSSLGLGESDSLTAVSDSLAGRLGYDTTELSLAIEEIARELERASEFFELMGFGPIELPRS